jgi:hypothetical protein
MANKVGEGNPPELEIDGAIISRPESVFRLMEAMLSSAKMLWPDDFGDLFLTGSDAIVRLRNKDKD